MKSTAEILHDHELALRQQAQKDSQRALERDRALVEHGHVSAEAMSHIAWETGDPWATQEVQVIGRALQRRYEIRDQSQRALNDTTNNLIQFETAQRDGVS